MTGPLFQGKTCCVVINDRSLITRFIVSFQGKTCCVVGGCGFLGRHLVETLLDRGYSVNVFDIRSTFEDERASFFIGDLCKQEVIINLKAISSCAYFLSF